MTCFLSIFQPENIICVNRNNMDIKIIDFGLAKQLSDKPIKITAGSPEFVGKLCENKINFSKGIYFILGTVTKFGPSCHSNIILYSNLEAKEKLFFTNFVAFES